MNVPTGKDSVELQRFLRALLARVVKLEPSVQAKQYKLGAKRATNVDSQVATEKFTENSIGSLAFLRLPNTNAAITLNSLYSGLFTCGMLITTSGTARSATVTGTAVDGTVNGTASWTDTGVGPGTSVPGTWKALGSCNGTIGYYSATLFIRVS